MIQSTLPTSASGSLERAEGFIPNLQDDISLGIASFEFVCGGVAILEQQFDRAGGAAIRERRQPRAVRLMGHSAKCHDGVRQHNLRHVIQFEQIQHEGGRADLQQERRRQNAGIAMEQMQSAVFPRVGQRFVAGINNRAIKLHPFEQIVVDVIGPLADLEVAVRAMPEQIAAEFRAGRGTHSARADKELAQSQKSEERKNVRFGERGGTADQVVFMAAKGRARIVIDIIANEADLVLRGASPLPPGGELRRQRGHT